MTAAHNDTGVISAVQSIEFDLQPSFRRHSAGCIEQTSFTAEQNDTNMLSTEKQNRPQCIKFDLQPSERKSRNPATRSFHLKSNSRSNDCQVIHAQRIAASSSCGQNQDASSSKVEIFLGKPVSITGIHTCNGQLERKLQQNLPNKIPQYISSANMSNMKANEHIEMNKKFIGSSNLTVWQSDSAAVSMPSDHSINPAENNGWIAACTSSTSSGTETGFVGSVSCSSLRRRVSLPLEEKCNIKESVDNKESNAEKCKERDSMPKVNEQNEKQCSDKTNSFAPLVTSSSTEHIDSILGLYPLASTYTSDRRVSLPIESRSLKEETREKNMPAHYDLHCQGTVSKENDQVIHPSKTVTECIKESKKRKRLNSGSEPLESCSKRKHNLNKMIKNHKGFRQTANVARIEMAAVSISLENNDSVLNVKNDRHLERSERSEDIRDVSQLSNDSLKSTISVCKSRVNGSKNHRWKYNRGQKLINKIHKTIARSADGFKMCSSTNMSDENETVDVQNVIPLDMSVETVARNVRQAKLRTESSKGSLHRRLSNEGIWNAVNSKY